MRHVDLRLLLPVVFAAASIVTVCAQERVKSHGPSFDCTKAVAPDEKAICADPDLSKLDVLINTAFKTYKPDFRPRKDIANELLAERRMCDRDPDCLMLAEANALETYGDLPDWVSKRRDAILLKAAREIGDKMGGDPAPPLQMGDCSVNKITLLGTRFAEGGLQSSKNEDGSAVAFDNQINLVSYDREPGLVRSRVGDPVIMCLASKPHDCPHGDDRGRFYFVLNQRTNQTWLLPNAQHTCGGA